MMLFLLLLALPIIFILYIQTHKTNPSKNVHPPGPPGLPFIGNLHQFDGEFPHTYLYNLAKQYGPIMSMKLGFRKLLVISSADVVKEIMKSHDAVFSSRPILVSLQKFSYNGLDIAFSPYNETWREMRKIGTIHLLSSKQLPYIGHIRKDEVLKMMKKISKDASLSKITNLSEATVSLASNIICRVIFGKSYGDEEEYGKNCFFDLLHETQALMGGFFVEDYFPLFGWIDKVSGMRRRLEKNSKELDCFYEEIIQEHLNPNRPDSMKGDVIDLLLDLKTNGSSSFHLTTEHIKALCLNLLSGGTDTSAAVTVWGLTDLMKNPGIMKKVQAEIRELGSDRNKDLIEEEDIAKLPYFRAVVKEAFRLYPPAPLLAPRETIKKCSINGYEIEAGTMVYLNAWAIARDPNTWENPHEFLPERFTESDVDVRGHDPEVIPFGIGRRGCPGQSIGMSNVEIALANVLYKFDWELPVGVKDLDFEALPGMTMHKKNELCLVPKFVIA